MDRSLGVLSSVFKLRIGFAIALSALAGAAIAPGRAAGWQLATLAAAVLTASAAAGAFNQLAERGLDARMHRTRHRPFVTGRFHAGRAWYVAILGLLLGAVSAAGWATNGWAALNVFLGAFTYGVVYTLWLKRRTPLNIVVGGLAGSFAVLAGAAAVGAGTSPAALTLAGVLFLWTPPHFWSLAFVHRADYARAGVPMLPVVVGEARAARIILVHTAVLVALSLLPVVWEAGAIYLAGAVAGGGWFLWTSIGLARAPSVRAARRNFHASLLQLGLLLAGVVLDAAL